MLRRGRAFVIGSGLMFLLVSGCSAGTLPALTPAHPSTRTTASTASTASTGSTASTPSAVSTRQPHILVFTATGDAAVDSVTYVVDGHSVTDSSVGLPWRASLTFPADGAMHNYAVLVNLHQGTVQILAILDGTVTGSSSGGGTGTTTAQLSGSIAG
jgi:hypothetical protein